MPQMNNNTAIQKDNNGFDMLLTVALYRLLLDFTMYLAEKQEAGIPS